MIIIPLKMIGIMMNIEKLLCENELDLDCMLFKFYDFIKKINCWKNYFYKNIFQNLWITIYAYYDS